MNHRIIFYYSRTLCVYRFYIRCLIVFLFSCRKDPVRQEAWGVYHPVRYTFPEPFLNFPSVPEPEWNLTTEEGVFLGRKLYYNDILSTNGRSCSSCHVQSSGFTISSMGPNEMGVPAHINLAWNSGYGWVGVSGSLDSAALADLEDGNIFLEANSDSILSRFVRHPDYPRLFWKAFGIDILSQTVAERNKYISYALAQFMRTQLSYNSKFDRYLRGEAVLTSDEMSGFAIFMAEDKGDCFHCHGSSTNPMWRDNKLHNNGLNAVFSGNDRGLYNVTGNPADMGKFRTPTLRNIEITAPYMHDGRFSTLQEVVDFYSTGLQYSSTVDPLMKKVGQGGVQLNPAEKAQLIAFLKTLTDDSFLADPKLGPPD